MVEAKDAYAGPPPTPLDVRANVNVYPKGRALPPYIIAHDWSSDSDPVYPPFCLRYAANKCDAFIVDLAGDGKEEVLFLDPSPDYNVLFAQEADGTWRIVGKPGAYWSCAKVIEAMKAGQFAYTTPIPNTWHQVQAGGLTLGIPPIERQQVGCPK